MIVFHNWRRERTVTRVRNLPRGCSNHQHCHDTEGTANVVCEHVCMCVLMMVVYVNHAYVVIWFYVGAFYVSLCALVT